MVCRVFLATQQSFPQWWTHGTCLGIFVPVVQYNWSDRPPHIDISAIVLCSRETVLMWLSCLQHMFNIHGWPAWWPPWSGPPLSHKPICMLHFSLDVPMVYGPTELQVAHPYVPSLGLSEPLQFLQPGLPARCFDVLQWHSSWACEHLRDVSLPYSSVFYLCSDVLPQRGSPDGFTSALPVGLFPLL